MDNTSKLIPQDLVIGLLSCVGGFTDGAGFYRLFSVFTSSITGNIVAVASAFATDQSILCRGLIYLSFFLSAVVFYALAQWLRSHALRSRHGHDAARVNQVCGVTLFTLELGMLGLIWGLGRRWSEIIIAAEDANEAHCVAMACLMATSMCLQTVAITESSFPKKWPSTIVVTSNTVTLGLSLQKLLNSSMNHALTWWHHRVRLYQRDIQQPDGQPASPVEVPETKESLAEVHKAGLEFRCMLTTVGGFIAGAIIGVSSMKALDWNSFFIPIAILIVIIADLLVAHRPVAAPVQSK